jgi:hypothetical protein
MVDKVIVKLRVGARDGELIETRPDGEERCYYPRTFGVSFVVSELRVGQAFTYRTTENNGPSLMQHFADGIAWLSEDYELSVIGEPQNKTRKVELQLRVDDRSKLPGHGRASLGFNRANWEAMTSDQWFLSLYLNSASLQPLIDAALAGTVRQMRLQVMLKGLYSDEPPYMPLDYSKLYLRPNARDNTIDMPERADGFLEGMRLDYATVDTRPPAQPMEVEQGEELIVSKPVVDPMLPAIQQLSAGIDALSGTVQWVGGLMAEPKQVRPAEEPISPEPIGDPMLPAIQQLGAGIDALRGTVKWVGGLIVACLVIMALK